MLLKHEREALATGFRRIAGVDEAGRGPLAGPVVAAAVLFDPAVLQGEPPVELLGLTDSKQLTAGKRDFFFDQLHQLACLWLGVGQATVTEIEDGNILQATYLAMQRAVEALDEAPDYVLVDGNRLPAWSYRAEALVKGDSKSLSIAAASVVAKVTRDRILLEIDAQYPQYGFARHKGYGTKAHLAALREHGPCEHHRRTFKPIAQLELFS